ncbi:uncharacterized protein LOC126563530 [Anopheles maculipalpis]|uniref:uncharacterized protein LOC126563530 n=1 Tax=Anopheles maculipalpis TaxID=1496333 RepID=UPI0021591B82|nr:uncharacterized protein LOC126563530 [Anopheles maculipalpis]
MEEAQTQAQSQGEQQQKESQQQQQQQGFGAYIALEDNNAPLTLVDELAFEKDDPVHVWIPTVTKPPTSTVAEGEGGPRVAWYKATNARTKQTGYVQLSKLSPLENIDPVVYSSGGARQYLSTGACVSIGCACVAGGLQQQQPQSLSQQTTISDAFGGMRLGGSGTTTSSTTQGTTDTTATANAEELYMKCVTPAPVLKDPALKDEMASRTSNRAHAPEFVYFVTPIICLFCQDYIWGLGRQGGQCRNCSACFHVNCLPMALYRPCQRNSDMYQNIPNTFRTEKSINEWTTENVLEWMTAVNMYDHVEVFKTKAIKGCDLPNLDRDKLEQMGIKNDFHQHTILTTIRQLLTSADMTAAAELPILSASAHTAVNLSAAAGPDQYNGHKLMNGSFSKQQKCDMCKNYLLGLVHQGLFCTQCRLVVHRQCSVMGLRPCTAADRSGTQQQQNQQSQQLTSTPTTYILGGAYRQEHQHIFGKSLCLLFDAQQQAAPQIVVDLCTSLEKKAVMDKALDLYVVYRTTPVRYDEVNKLRDALNENLLNIDLNGYTPECVATVLKKFFHELPDPLIPVTLYQSFIDASMLDDQQAVERMKAIIQDMAPHHNKTLQYFMRHLIRICRLQFMRGNKQQPTMLLQNWCHILMRPAWERIVLFVSNIKNHLRVLEILMYKLDWNEALPEFLSIPAVPPRKTSRTGGPGTGTGTGGGMAKKSIIASPEGGSSVGAPIIEIDYSRSTTQQPGAVGTAGSGVVGGGMLLTGGAPLVTDPDTPQELRDAEWYWGKISRDVAKEKMMDAQDGSFLVRDAINDAGEYTLVLKKDGTDRPIKIYHKNGKYGFTQDCTFESLVGMINEFRTTTLKEYNTILDISLLYPISRFEDESLYPTASDIHQLAQNFYETVQKLTDLQNMRESTLEAFNQTQSHVELRKQAQEAFIEADKLFNDQLQTQARYETEAQPHEKRSLAQNRSLIESRLEELRKCKKNLDEDMERERERMRELQREAMKLKPEILNLSKQKDQYLEALKRQAITDAQIKQILKDGYLSATNPDSTQDLPHLDETTWLRERYTRQDAEKKLANKPTGTFLIRARNAGHYALSIACDGRVNHCIIHQTERGYGFAEPYFIYDSLKSLVVHYATNSLEEHNDLLQTTLKYPAFAPNIPTSGGGGSGSGGSGGSGGGSVQTGGSSSSASSSTRQQTQQGQAWPGMTSFAA